MNYLTNIPSSANDYGISKVLSVRSEVIHIKHILTEIFVRKTINISKHLKDVDMDLFYYMEYMTNRIRKIHNFTREFSLEKPERVVKHRFDRFFPSLELFKGLNNIIVLDFDGVVTDRKFERLYNLCIERSKVHICSANPTITEEWFIKRELPLPDKIHSMKGKKKKFKRLLEINKKYDYMFYIDNEKKYLDFAWLFGIKTYHWNGKKIVGFSKSSK
jgi:hypothetical protein